MNRLKNILVYLSAILALAMSGCDEGSEKNAGQETGDTSSGSDTAAPPSASTDSEAQTSAFSTDTDSDPRPGSDLGTSDTGIPTDTDSTTNTTGEGDSVAEVCTSAGIERPI